MTGDSSREGLRIARLFMVLSSVSPLFVVWAIRGNRLIPDRYLVTSCATMVVLPYAFLLARIRTARRLNERRDLEVGAAEDHRDHLLVYLFTMLLPFYPVDLVSTRDLAAVLIALAFVIFLFWHLDLHYMNLLFLLLGYRVFTILPPKDSNAFSGKASYILITRRAWIVEGSRLDVYRLSDTVYFEESHG
jgi:hypothetical protein